MVFKRIDDENVSCIISENDMLEYDVRIDDFLKNSGKAHDFLKNIVSRAVEEVDFKASDSILSIKMMALPDNRLSIILSENPETNMNNMIDHMKDLVDESKILDDEILDNGIEKKCTDDEDEDMATENLTDEEREELFEEFINNFFGEMKQQLGIGDKGSISMKNKKKKSSNGCCIKIFCFETLSDVENFCSCIPKKLYVKSSLFREEETKKYYFVMEKSHISASKFNSICEQAMEFSTFVTYNKNYHSYLKEHCTCMIENKAAKILKRVALTV